MDKISVKTAGKVQSTLQGSRINIRPFRVASNPASFHQLTVLGKFLRSQGLGFLLRRGLEEIMHVDHGPRPHRWQRSVLRSRAVVPSPLLFHLPQFRLPVASRGLNYYVENSRNKRFVRFKFPAVLSRAMKPRDVSLGPTRA